MNPTVYVTVQHARNADASPCVWATEELANEYIASVHAAMHKAYADDPEDKSAEAIAQSVEYASEQGWYVTLDERAVHTSLEPETTP